APASRLLYLAPHPVRLHTVLGPPPQRPTDSTPVEKSKTSRCASHEHALTRRVRDPCRWQCAYYTTRHGLSSRKDRGCDKGRLDRRMVGSVVTHPRVRATSL